MRQAACHRAGTESKGSFSLCFLGGFLVPGGGHQRGVGRGHPDRRGRSSWTPLSATWGANWETSSAGAAPFDVRIHAARRQPPARLAVRPLLQASLQGNQSVLHA